MHYLTVGTLWKNEDEYAVPFVKYHKYVGVDKIIIFDREYNRIKELFKDEPMVEVVHFPDVPGNVHAEAWGQLIKYNQGKTKWLALIDGDECLVPVKSDNVKDVLKDFEQYASCQVNWHTFGSSGRVERGDGAVYERFLMRAKDNEGINNHTQFICQPSRTLPIQTSDPHHPKLPSNEISVNTNTQRVIGPYNSPPLHDKLWIAHYYTKSKEEWMIKNARGRADIYGVKANMDDFETYDKLCNEVYETRVLELWNKANGK